jgi:hypothetical protein
MKQLFFAFAFIICSISALAQKGLNKNDQHVILITLDGFRWQELFKGIDKTLMTNEEFTRDTSGLKKKF